MRSPAEVGAGDFNGNPSEGEDQELFNSIAADMDHENNQMAVDDDEDDDDDEEEDEEEEEEEEEDVEEEDEEDEDEECSNGSPGDEDAGELLSNGVGEENLTNTCQLNEEWQSGTRNTTNNLLNYFNSASINYFNLKEQIIWLLVCKLYLYKSSILNSYFTNGLLSHTKHLHYCCACRWQCRGPGRRGRAT